MTVSIEIAAPPDRVWQVLTAFDRYAHWHPTLSLRSAAPQAAPGAEVAWRLSGGAAGEQEFTALITEAEAPRRLAWQGGTPDVFFGLHTFELAALPSGGTRFTDTERWTGSMAADVISEHHATLQAEYARTAAALKAAAEAHDDDPGAGHLRGG